jgi:hypothetical protein
MDFPTRFVTYLILGAILLYCNVWYLRTLAATVKSKDNDYVILPIKVIGQDDKNDDRGIGLAQMLKARLETIARELAEARQQSKKPPPPSFDVLGVLRTEAGLSLIRQPPPLRASLFEPVNINVAVGDVQLGGVALWLQNLLVRRRTLSFTFYVSGTNKTTVAGDATPLTGSDNGAISFDSQGSLNTAISELSYELLRRSLTNEAGARMDRLLDRTEFQAFAGALVEAGQLGHIGPGAGPQSERYQKLFQIIWPVASQHVFSWPELGLFAADLAVNARDRLDDAQRDEAIELLNKVKQSATAPGVSPDVMDLINKGGVEHRVGLLRHYDVPVTLAGSTANSVVYYATALGSNGAAVARIVINKLETDLASISRFFGGIKLPKPLTIIVGDFGGGAYHHSCSDPIVYASVKSGTGSDAEFTNFLVASQIVDVFEAVQGKGWNCGASNGAGLKRVLATELYPAQLDGYATAATWLDTPDRPDWVNKNAPTDTELVPIGCTVLFLNYMHMQLKTPWDKIIQAGGENLGQTYTNLRLGAEGFKKFRQLMDAKFPIGRPSRLTTDNPFPI